MLRRILQKSSSSGLPLRLLKNENRSPPPHFLAACCFSDSGGGNDDDKSRVDDIYSDLFGKEDGAGDSWSGADRFDQRQGDKRSGGQQDPKTGFVDEDRSKDPGPEYDGEPVPLPVRLWSNSLEISEEEFSTKWTFDDIPDWSPDFVSRISKERVQLHEGECLTSVCYKYCAY